MHTNFSALDLLVTIHAIKLHFYDGRMKCGGLLLPSLKYPLGMVETFYLDPNAATLTDQLADLVSVKVVRFLEPPR